MVQVELEDVKEEDVGLPPAQDGQNMGVPRVSNRTSLVTDKPHLRGQRAQVPRRLSKWKSSREAK